MTTEIATRRCARARRPSNGSRMWAIAGSPTAPMAIEAIVIPTWQAEM